jgi:hypothetical protein
LPSPPPAGGGRSGGGGFEPVPTPTPTPEPEPVPTPTPTPATLWVTNLSIHPTEVQPNEIVTITVSVANTGGTEGSYTVILKINGEKEAEKSVTIAAGSSEIVTFTVTRDIAGTYLVDVDGLIGVFTVKEKAVLLNWWLIGAIIGLIAVGLLVYFLIIRKYYIQRDFFGVVKRYPISRGGKLRETIEATSADYMLTITIPEGTSVLSEDGKRLKNLVARVVEVLPPPLEVSHIIGLAYDFGPDGATFDPAITLTITYDPSLIPEGVAEENLVIAYYNEDSSQWIELDSVVNSEANTVSAKVSHFTIFAVIGYEVVVPPVVPRGI